MLASTNMNRISALLGCALAGLMVLAIGQYRLPVDVALISASAQVVTDDPAQLSLEERNAIAATVALIKTNGPFPYRKDGSEFSNREARLPAQGPGYYREYTVATLGSPDRGARRIVSGRAGELYYTRDHYRSFVRLN